MSEHGLSVVIPVRGRVEPLRRLLTSLYKARDGCPEPVEVIVVDDSDLADATAHQASCDAVGAQYVRGPRHVGAKRNVGVAAATYDLVQFIDSDCLASPDLLRRQIATLRSADQRVGAVAGPTYVEGSDSATYRVMSRSKLLNSAFEWPALAQQVGWATTSNLAVRRAAFEAVGGFAPRPLTVVGGEDVDLGLRLSEAGHAIICDPQAVVVHDRSSMEAPRTVLRRLVTYGRSGQWLLQVHPSRGRPKLNRLSALVVALVPAALTAPVTAGLSIAVVAALVVAMLAVDARIRLGADRPTGRALAESLACAVMDWAFDLGEFVGAWQLGRPDRLFTGFAWTEDPAFVWNQSPARRYGG
jgi:GT2 family glycosyltransferase